MIVPRSFARYGDEVNEKSVYRIRNSQSRNSSRSKSPFSVSSSPSRTSIFSSEPRSDPVQIPARAYKDGSDNLTPRPSLAAQSNQVMYDTGYKPKRASAHDLLSSTTIPVRRKPRGRASQRLPKGDNVADFSRLLWDDVKASDGSLSRSGSSSYIEGLFGTIDGLVEGQMIIGSEGVDESILAIRSISSDSLASLASPDDYGSSGLESHRSSLARSYETKRMRHLPSSESCVANHPLLETEVDDNTNYEPPPLPSSSSPVPPAAVEKKTRSFKSSLTASLKAIKSAAQSVSSKASLFASQDSEDFLARSFFDIHPFLTDDKRPPPGTSLPSPQLRRYLNPYSSNAPPDSPAQLHFWQDDRYTVKPQQDKKLKSKSRKRSLRNGQLSPASIHDLPPVVQLATCLPPSVRTEHASSPPIWLNPDGTPSNKHTATPLLQDPETLSDNTPLSTQIRHREPRENRDFLRVFVCEMEMRRRGKLSDDMSTGRARLWLPPVGHNLKGQAASEGPNTTPSKQPAATRWQGWTADEL